MIYKLVKEVPELDCLTRSTLDAMAPKEFDSLFEEVGSKYKSKWMNAFNHLMLREYESDFVNWDINEAQISKVDKAIPGILNKKKDEKHHKSDGSKETKRWKTGKESEFVVQNYTGFRFVDLEAYDNSQTAAGPDLIGRVGVKSSSFNNFPVIKRDGKHKIPEILVVKYGDTSFKIAGLFTPDMLNKYTSDKLVKMYSMLSRKTAFYHYGVGIKFGPGRENLSMLLYDLGY
jgi:hypothetical protein